MESDLSVAKSADAFRTISEAATELDVPQHVLRHWEEVFGQIRPMRRAGGRRYYRPLDIDLLRGVRVLLYDERYTTKGVQKIFKKNGVKYIAEIGRRSAAGEGFDLLPDLDEEDREGFSKTVRSSRSDNGGDNAAASPLPDPKQINDLPFQGSPSPALRARLEHLLTQLEKIHLAIDEATLAIEAIDPDGDA